ncbi:MAG: sulfite exporter TauE/SafE family protein [Nostocaceae cyanobacterium]|nr:sulfite exporter TauE/SafE family protein [Nostocaceae cyanobacterium]
MDIIPLLVLILVFFVTSIISVITGSTSLITIPVMLQVGVEAHTAIATNMLALTFMSIGGTLPFIGKNTIDINRLPLLILLTIAGSILGALLVLIVPTKAMPVIISCFMVAIAAFSIVNRDAGLDTAAASPSPAAVVAAYGVTFILGIYGGFFSGGYVTLLTAAYVALFRMTFLEAVANTKLINVFSSLVATIIFIINGIVDYQLGIILSITMFIGGLVGAQVAIWLSNKWLRRIFITTVIILAIKTLFDGFDLFSLSLLPSL